MAWRAQKGVRVSARNDIRAGIRALDILLYVPHVFVYYSRVIRKRVSNSYIFLVFTNGPFNDLVVCAEDN